MDDDPLLKLIAPLAGVVLAVVLSIMVAASVAGQIGDDYATRAWIYTAAVLWVLVGAVVVFMLVHRGESRRLTTGRVLLWTASIWLWPLIALRALPRRTSRDNEPPAPPP
jgi:cell division protein FtsW (lipid II flippase)